MTTEHREPKVGDFLKPDHWHLGENLSEGEPADQFWQGCQLRVKTFNAMMFYKCGIPVNIKITGKPIWNHSSGMYASRVKVEFVKDGEVSEFSGGYLFHRQF